MASPRPRRPPATRTAGPTSLRDMAGRCPVGRCRLTRRPSGFTVSGATRGILTCGARTGIPPGLKRRQKGRHGRVASTINRSTGVATIAAIHSSTLWPATTWSAGAAPWVASRPPATTPLWSRFSASCERTCSVAAAGKPASTCASRSLPGPKRTYHRRRRQVALGRLPPSDSKQS